MSEESHVSPEISPSLFKSMTFFPLTFAVQVSASPSFVPEAHEFSPGRIIVQVFGLFLFPLAALQASELLA
jgi:hypothetical protein